MRLPLGSTVPALHLHSVWRNGLARDQSILLIAGPRFEGGASAQHCFSERNQLRSRA
jgi:hypothetical protein